MKNLNEILKEAQEEMHKMVDPTDGFRDNHARNK